MEKEEEDEKETHCWGLVFLRPPGVWSSTGVRERERGVGVMRVKKAWEGFL